MWLTSAINEEKPKTTLLWLDDKLDPSFKEIVDTYSPISNPDNIVWVKEYWDFIDYILENKMPDAVCFDYDLGESYETGYDCAKFLVEHCIDNNLPIPRWGILTKDPEGRDAIFYYMVAAQKYLRDRH